MLNFFKVLAHSPAVLQAFMAMNSAQGKMTLDPKLRELAYLKASAVNDCAYCLHYHTKSAKKVGLTDEQVGEVISGGPASAFDDLQSLVMTFAEQVSKNVRAEDSVIAALKERLSDAELADLTATVALANYTNRVNEALAIDLP